MSMKELEYCYLILKAFAQIIMRKHFRELRLHLYQGMRYAISAVCNLLLPRKNRNGCSQTLA